MYIFVVSRNINMFSKQKMFKINNSFDEERFEVRAVQCARYILYHIFIILREKNIIFSYFPGLFCEIYVLRRKIKQFSSLFA